MSDVNSRSSVIGDVAARPNSIFKYIQSFSLALNSETGWKSKGKLMFSSGPLPADDYND